MPRSAVSLSRRIALLLGLMGVTIAAVIGMGALGFARIIGTAVDTSQRVMEDGEREKLALVVKTTAQSLAGSISAGEGGERQVAIIRNALSPIRFEEDRSGYFFVYDFHGKNVVHPVNPEFEGTNRLKVRDPNGKPYIEELLKQARLGGGYVEYSFNKPSGGVSPKLAYSIPIAGTDYWLATGLYVDNIERERRSIAHHLHGISWKVAAQALALVLVMVVAVVLPVSRRMVRGITVPLQHATRAAQAVAQGDYSVQLEGGGVSELDVMSRAFNDMTAQVRASHEQLESAVRQRTAELSATVDELRAANGRIMESIQYARTIQQALLPQQGSLASRLRDHFVIWSPKDVIGGDLYWFEGAAKSFLVAVLDCTGHGVPGALMTMLAATTLSRVVGEIGPGDPAQILTRLNTHVRQLLSLYAEETTSDDGLDIGLCLVEPEQRRVVFAGARISLFAVCGDALEEVKGNRSSIGYKTSRDGYHFTNAIVDLRPGTCLYLHTDGLSDQVGGARQLPLGAARLKAALLRVQGQPMSRQREEILQLFESYRGANEQRDDVTVLGFSLD